MRAIAVAITAALAMAAVTTGAAARCKVILHETTVCDDGRKIVRIVRGSVSPSKRLAVGWAIEGHAQTMHALDEDQRPADEPAERSFSTDNRDHVWNYLVRLPDGKLLKKLDGRHFGDRQRYNHYTHEVYWSPDERTFIQVTHWRFGTSIASAYRIEPSGIAGPLPLIPPSRSAALPLANDSKEADYLSRADATVEITAVENDGTLRLTTSFAVPKDPSIDFNIAMRVGKAGRARSSEIVSIERQKD